MVEVIQADRDAAADWLADEFGPTQPFLNAVRHGRQYEPLIEAFARHRIEAQSELQATVVRLEAMVRNSCDALATAAHELEASAPCLPEQSRSDVWRSAAECRSLAKSYRSALSNEGEG